MKNKLLLALALWVSLLGSTWAQSNALHFDGTNDYVECPAMNPAAFTMEAWVYPTLLNRDQAIISTLSVANTTGMELHVASDNMPLVTIRNGSNWLDVKANADIALNTWTHIAATYNGSTVKLYVNGVEAISDAAENYAPGDRNLYIARRPDGEETRFNGRIDEVRIWSTARTQTDIADAKNSPLAGTEANLLAYYSFNQGTAGGSNTGVTSLTDASTNGKNGTLNGFALSGSTSNWVEGYPLQMKKINNALHFDGKDDYVSWPSVDLFFYTLEAWINPSELSRNQAIISTKCQYDNVGVELRIGEDNIPVVSMYLFVGSIEVKGTYAVKANNWTHLAATYDGSLMKLYVDGVLVNSAKPKMSVMSKPCIMNIGRRASPNISGDYYFSGKIDEVRLWYMARSEAEIVETMSNALKGDEQCLLAYYNFNQGVANGENKTDKTLSDLTESGNHGQLNGFALDGSSSNWVKGWMPPKTAIAPLQGDGTSANPYQIASVQNLYWLSQTTSVWDKGFYFKQTAEIDLLGINDWTPIGNTTTRFSGSYDGSGFTIRNLTINSSKSNQALFGGTGGSAVLKNITMENARVAISADYAAILVANHSGTITNCHTKGGAVSALNYAGGFCASGSGSIENCSNSASLSVSKAYAAGISAYMQQGAIRRCTNSGSVSSASNNANIGGIVGYVGYSGLTNAAMFTVENCCNTGDINTTGMNAGGIVGLCGGANMQKCYSTGVVTGSSNIGGLIGYCDERFFNSISSCYALQKPVIGNSSTGKYTSLNNVDVKAKDQMQLPSTYKGWDFINETTNGSKDYWAIFPGHNNGYPMLAYLASSCTNGVVDMGAYLTVSNGNGSVQTTVYTWCKGDGTTLTTGVDYIEKDGVFQFYKLPGLVVYCIVRNVAIPDWIARTNAITIDGKAGLEPNVTFVSQKSGNLSFSTQIANSGKVYVDWGDGNWVVSDVGNTIIDISTTSYTANNTVKIHGDKIVSINVSNNLVTSLDVSKCAVLQSLYCSGNNLSAIDLSKNINLNSLDCNNNKLSALDVNSCNTLRYLYCQNNQLNFSALPQNPKSCWKYVYSPQSNFVASCASGIVDIRSQLSATDKNSVLKTTSYTWYNADGTQLVKGIDYNGKDGIFYFMKNPAGSVYCTMVNAAFPDFSGDYTFRTNVITVDVVHQNTVTFVSNKNGVIKFSVKTTEETPILVDWGKGLWVGGVDSPQGTKFSTSSYVAGETVKIIGNAIYEIDLQDEDGSNEITSLDVSHATELGYLQCSENQLTTLNVSSNTKLETLICDYNLLTTLDLSENTALTSLSCCYNQLITLDLTNNTALIELCCNDNKLSFVTLPQTMASYTNGYYYLPQANLAAICTNGIVDLSLQLSAKDIDGNQQTTSYACFSADDHLLSEGIDYMVDKGKIYFLTVPVSHVYCQMKNDAFPGLTLRTVDFTVDKVGKVSPVITWSVPADIEYGTPLSEAQLNAQSNVPGSFVYSPIVGTVLKAGNNQSLSVIFTPEDATIYSTATATVAINVNLTTGMNDDAKPVLSLFPNPTINYVTIKGSESIERVLFVNAVGKTVMVEEAPSGSIAVSSLKPGLYLVEVICTNGEVEVLRMVKH